MKVSSLKRDWPKIRFLRESTTNSSMKKCWGKFFKKLCSRTQILLPCIIQELMSSSLSFIIRSTIRRESPITRSNLMDWKNGDQLIEWCQISRVGSNSSVITLLFSILSMKFKIHLTHQLSSPWMKKWYHTKCWTSMTTESLLSTNASINSSLMTTPLWPPRSTKSVVFLEPSLLYTRTRWPLVLRSSNLSHSCHSQSNTVLSPTRI